DPVDRQVPAGPQRPLRRPGDGQDHREQDEERDEQPHESCLPSCAASTARRNAVLAAPTSRPTSGASSVQAGETRSGGKPARGPGGGPTGARNRAVLDSARRPAWLRRPMIAFRCAAGLIAGGLAAGNGVLSSSQRRSPAAMLGGASTNRSRYRISGAAA